MRALSWVAAPGVAALLTACLPVAVHAQALTESAAITRALADNPRLRAIRATPAQTAAEQRVRRVAPNPSFSFAQESAAGTRDRFYVFQQELPLSGRLSFLKQAGAAAVLAEDLRVKQAEFEIRQATRAAFAQLAATQSRMESLRAMLTTLDSLTNRLAEREKAGDGSAFDRLRAERELADLNALRRQTEADLARDQATLAGLMGMTGAPPLVVASLADTLPPAPALDVSLASAAAQRVDLQAADAEISRIEFDQRAASRIGWPQPIASAGWKQTDVGGHSDTGYTMSIGVAIPLFNRGQAGVEAAGATLTLARLDREAVAIEIAQDVRVAHARAAIAQALSDEYRRDALGRSRELVRIATLAYDDGEIGILELLDAHRSLVSAELRSIEFSTDARLAMIRLDRATGREAGR